MWALYNLLSRGFRQDNALDIKFCQFFFKNMVYPARTFGAKVSAGYTFTISNYS